MDYVKWANDRKTLWLVFLSAIIAIPLWMRGNNAEESARQWALKAQACEARR